MTILEFYSMPLFLSLLFFSTLLWGQHCIQVLSYDASFKNALFQEAQKSYYKEFKNVRIEERLPYYTLRIGKYKKYKNGLKDLKKIKKYHKDAFLRRCDYKSSSTAKVQNYPAKESKKSLKKQQTVLKDHTLQGESSVPVWESCRRCFAPLYKEEKNKLTN